MPSRHMGEGGKCGRFFLPGPGPETEIASGKMVMFG